MYTLSIIIIFKCIINVYAELFYNYIRSSVSKEDIS